MKTLRSELKSFCDGKGYTEDLLQTQTKSLFQTKLILSASHTIVMIKKPQPTNKPQQNQAKNPNVSV